MYPSLYYAFKDLFGIDLQFLKMIQSFGFFVAIAFLTSAYFLGKELQRKEEEGLIQPQKIKVLKGKKANSTDYLISGVVGFLIGFKLLFIALNFSSFLEDTQGFLLSAEGSFMGGVIGAVLSAYLKYRESESTKLENPVLVEELIPAQQQVGNIVMIAAIAGLIGAKIFHNLENWDEFMADPIDALISFSGLTMYGGLIVGGLSVIYYGRKNGIGTRHLIDAAAPSIMIGYAVGRIGCQVSGDGDWGIDNLMPKPEWMAALPDWMWSYDYPHNVNSVGVPMADCVGRYCYHLEPSVFPTPFYETIMCGILFFVLWMIRKRVKVPGMLFSIYLVFNGLERFFIEKIRVNTTMGHLGNYAYTQAEFISTLLFLLGIVGIIYFKKKEQAKS